MSAYCHLGNGIFVGFSTSEQSNNARISAWTWSGKVYLNRLLTQKLPRNSHYWVLLRRPLIRAHVTLKKMPIHLIFFNSSETTTTAELISYPHEKLYYVVTREVYSMMCAVRPSRPWCWIYVFCHWGKGCSHYFCVRETGRVLHKKHFFLFYPKKRPDKQFFVYKNLWKFFQACKPLRVPCMRVEWRSGYFTVLWLAFKRENVHFRVVILINLENQGHFPENWPPFTKAKMLR